MNSTAQARFNEMYITSPELCKVLNIKRSTLCKKVKCKMLPEPVQVNGSQIHIWERETIKPFLNSCKESV